MNVLCKPETGIKQKQCHYIFKVVTDQREELIPVTVEHSTLTVHF